MGKRIKVSELKGDCTRTKPYRVEDAEGNYSIVNPSTPTSHIGIGQGVGGGQKPAFESKEAFIRAFNQYMDDIALNGYNRLPTKTDFARCNKISHQTVYQYFNRMTDSEKKSWETALADTITEGVNAGKYNTTMSIFALKNWCNWADKQESKVEKTEKKLASKEEAQEQLKKYSEGLKLAK